MTMGRDEGETRRLLEETDPTGFDPQSTEGWAIGLLRRTPPYQPMPGRKQRIRLALGQGMARRSLFLLRPAIVTGILLGCGAIASAALGEWPRWIVRAYEQVVGREPVSSAPPAEGDRRTRARGVAAPARAAHQPLALLETESAPPLPLPAPAADPAPRRARRSAGAPGSEPASPVLQAMRALRVDRDPVRARALLSHYLERHPNGALAEEALALSIEAALAHRDPDAASLGARYLRRYPRGPFQPLAQRAVSAR